MHSSLDDYLQEVEDRLHSLPLATREYEMRKTRAVFKKAVDSRVKDGKTQQLAVINTMEQFGAPYVVAQDVVARYKRSVLPGNVVSEVAWILGLLVCVLAVGIVLLRIFGQPLPSAKFILTFLLAASGGAVIGAINYVYKDR